MASDLLTKHSTDRGYELQLQRGLFINNEFISGSAQIDVVNPANGKLIVRVEAAGEEEVDAAVSAANKAYKEVWSKSKPSERRDLISRLADLVERDQEELAQIETLNCGKAITFARHMDAVFSAEYLRYYAGWADKIQGKVIETDGVVTMTRHEPFGACAAIIPWNFPVLMLMIKLGPMLATGNTVVIKTSEVTPLSALKIAALSKEAGFPAGVINIITGYGHITGELLSRHHGVDKVAFTGSVRAGRLVMKAAAESNLKKVTLELGGKSPNIIFGDANIEKAVKWAYRGIYFNQGQVCTAGSRIYVQENIYDNFIKRFKEYIAQARIGHPLDDTTIQGPQVSKTQYDRVMAYIESGKQEGATIALGGERWGNEGYYIQPTIFTGVKENMKIMQEEIFGPVVCISKFKDIEEAIDVANKTSYGLAAAVFSQNLDTCLTVSEKVEAGIVWINCINMYDASTPMGGFKESGIGREGGEYGLSEYTQVKAVKINRNVPI
ncbi:aldehyde dehydrogenase domain-containing protein [Umbelopsis sp. PMI_123]|nr:aldehyde dehydrogenase domain-containing protein [Umbelopsis sp. PMI_123]